MEEQEEQLEKVLTPPDRAGRLAGVLTLLAFGFGTIAGFLLAFSGLGFLAERASLVAAVFFVALVVIGLLGLGLFLVRERILRRLFGLAETQIEAFAGPLSAVAEKAVQRDPEGATGAARELVQRVLARYAWLSTRRWIIASLTALIAAMAALAGTALLFQQNQLLGAQNAMLARQSELMQAQNERIREQSQLLLQSVQLAEAQRNAGLAVEITGIAEALGAAVAAAADQRGAARDGLQVLDPARDLGGGLIMRIVAASQAARPYRFLDTGLNSYDQLDKARQAMLARRQDLPEVWQQVSALYGWQVPEAGGPRLIDRPQSPERGQLLRALINAGVVEQEVLNFRGMDLSFAQARGLRLILTSMQGAQLAYADLSGAVLREVDLGGAYAENIRLVGAAITDSSFASVPAAAARPPFARAPGVTYVTFLTGADFSRAQLANTSFADADLTASNFDGALLQGVDFSQASLAAATLRGAVLIDVDFTGAALNSVDLDGAVLFGTDPLAALSAAAAEGSFRADRYRAEPIAAEQALATGVAAAYLDAAELARLSQDAQAFRLLRTGDFGQ